MVLIPFETTYTNEWDELVHHSRNATFLHERAYVGYLGDKPKDVSILFKKTAASGKAIAGLIADLEGERVVSHGFLTYGGLIMHEQLHVTDAVEAIKKAVEYYRHETGARDLIYKPVPLIYHTQPSTDDLYALSLQGARLVERKVAGVIDLENWTIRALDTLRQRELRKAHALGLVIKEASTDDWAVFHAILRTVLHERHNAAPVHSLEELRRLHSLFPRRIRLAVVWAGNTIVGGSVVYLTQQVAHCQYIATSDEGKKRAALTLLFVTLAENLRGKKRYLDFGTSMEPGDGSLNKGLALWKESFGARTVTYDTYSLTL